MLQQNGLHDQELRKSDEAELEAVTFEETAQKGFVNCSVCKSGRFHTEMARPQVISEFFVLYSLKTHGFEMIR